MADWSRNRCPLPVRARQTFQPATSFGRLYAAYAGVFLLGAMTWGWIIDGARPDTADLLGGGIVLVGITIILWGRNLTL